MLCQLKSEYTVRHLKWILTNHGQPPLSLRAAVREVGGLLGSFSDPRHGPAAFIHSV